MVVGVIGGWRTEMSMDYLATFLAMACAGLGLLVAGVANLLLVRRGIVVRALGTALGLGVGAGAAYALDQPGTVVQTAQILGIGVAVFLLLGWSGPVTFVSRLVASLRYPGVRFGFMSICGIATVTGAVIYYQWADAKAIDADTKYLELVHARVPCLPSTTRATTDRGTAIVLKEVQLHEPVDLGWVENQTLRAEKLDEQVIRCGPASDQANCHGWVFTGGRFHLGPQDVELILKENGYEQINAPQPGDVVIYRHGKEITHTAAVRYVTPGLPVMVESKWGILGVFLHPADRSIYGPDFTFHRSSRSGHLLVGLGGPSNTTHPSTSTTK